MTTKNDGSWKLMANQIVSQYSSTRESKIELTFDAFNSIQQINPQRQRILTLHDIPVLTDVVEQPK